MNKKWIVREKKSGEILEQVLLNRGLSKKDWEKFLKPDFNKDLFNPMLLPDIKPALARLKKAIENKEAVGIYGDYDADGIPGSALLAEALEKCGLETHVYIPSRVEGYGLSKDGIKFLYDQKIKLLITVDLGIREVENTKFAESLGLDVIITDHHEPGSVIPKALAVINPKLKTSRYPFRELSGGGVVFKLIQAMSLEFGKISQNDLKWMLDLVAVTTICDVVPLVSENRIFAKYGLIVLQKARRLGLKKLYEAANIDPQEINAYTVGFQIGPRLNAPGRMNQANESFLLLRSKDEKEAEDLAKKLNKINIDRQNELEKILKEARLKIAKDNLDKKRIICLADKNWKSGLIGLVAGKLMEEFFRPCLVFEKGENFSKGSARSIENFNLVEVLEQSKEYLTKYGGHSRAAGLTVENKKFLSLYKHLLKMADEKIAAEDLIPNLNIDAIVAPSDLNLSLFDELVKLEPFGLGNPRPIFVLNDVNVSDLRIIGKDKTHLKFKADGIDAVAFGMAELKTKIENANKVDIAFTLDEDLWRERKIKLKISDIKMED